MAQRISTIIPCYNRADLIGETLRSVLGQTRPPHEVIVVDDGSTDGSADVVGTFGAAVKLIRQTNAGAGPARNAGFAASIGDMVHFMDSDDLSSLNSYAVAAARIEEGADMTYGPWLKTRFDGTRLDPEPVALQQAPVPGPMDLLVLAMKWVTVFQPCFFRRSLIEQIGPYRADLKPSEDTELLYRILAAARAPVHTPDPRPVPGPPGKPGFRAEPRRAADRPGELVGGATGSSRPTGRYRRRLPPRIPPQKGPGRLRGASLRSGSGRGAWSRGAMA